MEVVTDNVELFKKAKGYALRLFKLRPRSIFELRTKLAQRLYSVDIINKLLTDFTANGYLNDTQFSQLWIQSRLKRYGRRRVFIELQRKGVSPEIIQDAWGKSSCSYNEEEMIADIVKRRLRVSKEDSPLKQRKRLTDYLYRRGFSVEMISRVLRTL